MTIDGKAARSNQAAASVLVQVGTVNAIGDNPLGDRNVVSGNNPRNPVPSTTAGVLIRGTGTDNNSVNNNVIGPSAAGEAVTNSTPALVQNVGVQIEGGAKDNVVGATKKTNSVSLNRIGTNLAGDDALPGPTSRGAVQETGIQFRQETRGNFVGVGTHSLNNSPGFGNTIAFNDDDGVLIGGTQEMAAELTDAHLICLQ